jgi:Uma2 family endonuclease
MSDMVVSKVRHQVTVDEYRRMDAAGIFPHGARIELVEGDLMETLLPMNPPHANVVEFLTRVLVLGIGDRALVRCQLPVTLGDLSEPEPDFAIVEGPRALYRSRHPDAAEIFGIIEVAGSSREFDMRRKAPLYGTFGIPEVWVVDLVDSCVHVFREPVDGTYRSRTVASFHDDLPLFGFPDVRVLLADMLEP